MTKPVRDAAATELPRAEMQDPDVTREIVPTAFERSDAARAGWVQGFTFYPILAAVYAAVRVAAGNAFDVSFVELASIVAVCAVAGLLVLALIFVLLRKRSSPPAIGLIGLAVLTWAFDAEALADNGLWIGLRSRDALIVLTIATLLTVGWLTRTRRSLRSVSRTACVVVVALSLLAAAEFGVRRIAIGRALGRSEFLAATTRPLGQPTHVVPGRRHDFYFLILDNYANADVLAERHGFDNQPFLDSLRALGFGVTRSTRSNYGWTPLSLASIFSGEHVHALEQDTASREASWDVLYTAIKRSRVLAAFKQAGYRIFVIPSAYFAGTQDSEVGTAYLPASTRSVLMRLARMSLARAVIHGTVPGRLVEKTGRVWIPAAVELAPFTGTLELATVAGPKVVVAHSLIAHEPFVFDANCRRSIRKPDESSSYADEIRCTNVQVLGAIHAIQANDPESVILILGDHGSMSPGLGPDAVAEQITRGQAFERFGAIRAARLPQGLTLPDTATPVNVIRRVTSAALGIDLSDLPDSSYWSTLAEINHFVAVDSLLSASRRPEPAKVPGR